MSLAKRLLISTLAGLVAGCMVGSILFVIAFALAGVGHGNNIYIKLFFPFAMLYQSFHAHPTVEMDVYLSIIQYPTYGFLLGAMYNYRVSILLITIFWILSIHSGCVALVYHY